MARDENLPFQRGKTWYGGRTIDPTQYGAVNLEGKTWVIEDRIYGSGQFVKLMVVRNSGTFNLLPKRLVVPDPAYYAKRVIGYTNTVGQAGWPVDELLPAAGVPPGDLFYVVVSGPAAVLTDLASGAGSVIAVGDPLVSIAAATSGATSAGRVATISAASTNIPLTTLNVVGRATAAATTSNTNFSMPAFVRNWLCD